MTTTKAPPDNAILVVGHDLRVIPIEKIAPDPAEPQPRRHFDADALAELGVSLAAGQTTPIKVRARKADEGLLPPEIEWVLINGERRLRAAQAAGIPQLRAEVEWRVAPQDREAILLQQLAENLQREDLNAVEQAAGIRRYAELTELGTRALALKLGKRDGYVSFALGMNKMPTALVKRIEENARGVGTPDGEPYALTWKHLRQLLRLTDYPDWLTEAYDDAVTDRSTARELERAVSFTLEQIELERQRVERREAEAKRVAEGGEDARPASPKQTPVSQYDEKRKREALEAARMTRARKDVIRGMLPDLVRQGKEIAVKIELPADLARRIAFNVRCYDAATSYADDLAQLIVPELRGQWTKREARIGSATNAGGWVRDDQAGRYWLAFTHWLATEAKGMDRALDREAKALLKDRDAGRVSRETVRAKPAPSTRGMIQAPKAAKGRPAGPHSDGLICARDNCKRLFHVKQGHKGRRPKYCAEHRSR